MKDENTLIPIEETNITDIIYTIREKQVMLDSNLASLYQVTTKRLNEQVSRNKNRFPAEFMFRLTKEEYENLRSQFATSSADHAHGGRRYMPYAFTEQGIAMLSAVLKSDIAVEVSIRIMNSFVEMRKFLFSNQQLFSRLDRVELKQLETDKKLEEVFNYIASNTEVKQKIFFDGQIYDAFSFIADLIGKAQKKLTLIDNYVDVNTLNILCKKKSALDVLIATAGKGSLTTKDINKFNAQYLSLSVKTTEIFMIGF